MAFLFSSGCLVCDDFPHKMISKRVLFNLLILLLLILVNLLFFWPLFKNISSLIIDDYDGLMITWSLNRVVQNIPNFPKLMEGNIFYPFKYSHAYSDAFITDGLIALPFIKLFEEPVTGFNINLVISQVLVLYFTFLFLSILCQNWILSFLLSLVFGFSQIRVHYLGHLQMFSLYWIPLAGFALMKFAKSSKFIYLFLFFIAFLCQTLNSFLPGYFVIFLFLSLFLGDLKIRKAVGNNLIYFLIGCFVTGIILFPIIRIYLTVSKTFSYVRPIQDVIHFSLSPEEIFTKFFSPTLILLFVTSLILYFTSEESIRSPRRWYSLTFLGVAVGSFIMALGPALHFFGKTLKIGSLPIPLPYAFFYYLIPGFKGFRTPSRWIFMFGLGAICFIAIATEKFLKKKSKSIKILIYLLISVSLITFTKITKTYFKVPTENQYSEIYSWLEKQPGQVIIELPIYYWGDLDLGKREVYRMLFSLKHQKKMVNGYSGFSPPEWEELVIYLRDSFPSKESILKIKGLKVDYLIVHEDEFKDLWPKDFQEKISSLKESDILKEEYRKGKDVVYTLLKNTHPKDGDELR